MLILQALSTTVLRTQTTAQLEALASITKAPSTSSLIAAANAAKKGTYNHKVQFFFREIELPIPEFHNFFPASGNSSVLNSGGTNNRLTPKYGSAASASKFSSRIFRSPMNKKAATKSATKVGPSGGLLNLKSFLPGKAPTVQKPTGGK